MTAQALVLRHSCISTCLNFVLLRSSAWNGFSQEVPVTTYAISSSDLPHEHDDFLPLLPIIRRYAGRAFRRWPADHCEEAVAETTAAALISFIRLKRRGKNPLAFPTQLVRWAITHVLAGRRVGSRDNSRDVMNRAAQVRYDFGIDSFTRFGYWHYCLIDHSQTPVPDQVCFRLDFAAWLQTLSLRDQRVAMLLAEGYSTSEVAQRFQVSAGRISQLRREMCDSWELFQADEHPIKT